MPHDVLNIVSDWNSMGEGVTWSTFVVYSFIQENGPSDLEEIMANKQMTKRQVQLALTCLKKRGFIKESEA